jgi:hypothetical protein
MSSAASFYLKLEYSCSQGPLINPDKLCYFCVVEVGRVIESSSGGVTLTNLGSI